MIVNKPPMGFNTWNTFGENINEKLILETADAMVATGLRDAGYNYVVIDDIWAKKERDESGHLVPDPEKFPHGMKYIADYIHSKGLKFGMYSCAGYMTCAGYPGSFEYEWIDALSFASWEVDFLKYDYCYRTGKECGDILYKRMSLALANCGRDILLSACSWGSDDTKIWIKETGAQMWRSTGDINDSWASIKSIAQSQITELEYNGKGCFNDMDMLVVGMNGNGNVGLTGCTEDEYRLHFSLWALLSSPLMIGCDIRNMSDATKSILTNREVIAVNQDEGCRQPFFVNMCRFTKNEQRNGDEPFYKTYPTDLPIIAKYLDGGDIAIGFFNMRDSDTSCFDRTVLIDALGLPVTTGKTLELYDLWSGEKINTFNGTIQLDKCPAHGCRLLRAKVVDAK